MHELVLALISFIVAAASPEATIVFAGDAMQHEAQLQAAKRTDGSYNYSECFSGISDYVSAADFAVVNLETPVGDGPYTGYPCFNAPTEFAAALSEAGFDLFLTANNHTLDRRGKGLKSTIDFLDGKEIKHIGTYISESRRDSILPFIQDIKGIRVGFLNYTYGTNGFTPDGDVVVDYIDRERMQKDIELTRRAGAELIAVCVHWGVEYVMLPNSNQKSLADFLVDQGVDMVIGGHPHVIQPMEIREGNNGKKALVVYSLGNFISNMKTRDTRGGAMAKVVISRDSVGNAIIKDATYSLTFTERPAVDNTNFRVVPAEEVEDSNSKDACRQFVNSVTEIFDRNNRNVSREYIRALNKIN